MRWTWGIQLAGAAHAKFQCGGGDCGGRMIKMNYSEVVSHGKIEKEWETKKRTILPEAAHTKHQYCMGVVSVMVEWWRTIIPPAAPDIYESVSERCHRQDTVS